MKFRLTLSVVSLSMFLAACTFSGDITPPPDYQSPTPPSTALPATPTPPLSISESAAETPQSVVGENEITTPSAVTVGGIVTMASGSSLPEGLTATLSVYDTTAKQVEQTLEATVQPGGLYWFEEVPSGDSLAYWVSVEYVGVAFNSDPAFYAADTYNYDLPIVLYETSDDLSVLTLDQVNILFELSSQGVLQVTELYIVTNPGEQAVVFISDGTHIPFIHLPEGASDDRYQMADGSAPLLSTEDGFALLPGADKQYGILTAFTLPYDSGLTFTQSFPLAISSLTAFVPQAMHLSSSQLAAGGSQEGESQTYSLYQAKDLPSGSSLSLTLSDASEASSNPSISLQTGLLIGLGALGILLIGLGVYLFLRERARARKEKAEEQKEESSSGEERDSLMDAIIALDDQYRAGEISRAAYETRRAELKQRLEKLIG